MQAVLEYTERAPQSGTRIGPYRLLKRVKQGGMSTVYQGYYLLTRVYVAIKVVDSSTVDLKMVYREIEIMQALEHEHIVPCLDAGAYGRYYYLVMPKVLPRGTRIECTAIFDNSANNPYNPDPKSTVFWGPQSWDEMMIGWMDVAVERPPEASASASAPNASDKSRP